MELNITINGDQLDSQLAARQLRRIADLVKDGTMSGEGFNIEYNGDFTFSVDFPEDGPFPHGDYVDAEGNLLHIAGGHVVNVTWATKGAEQEDVEIPVLQWVTEHGEIKPAGHGGDQEGHSH